MPEIGQSLAHYTLAEKIGKGGMGEVFRAKDQKLGRDVAIKVLPEEFARDTERVARFQREAKLLASLNHPNIAAIHGLEDSEGTHFLVLELVEGDTLSDRIKAGPIPVEESLKLALQIAEALEAAHEKGVIHRDLKPSNIKVTPEGKVKVLDFGLAKAYAGDQGDMILSDSPTISAAATQKGLILGTAAYMSPEQAKGKTVDKKTDIWAFGCVFYEILTGKAAFQGDEVSEILASVIKGDTNLDLLPANIHPRIRELLTRCLQKDTRRRYSGIGDARYEIEQVLADPSGVLMQPVPAVRQRKILSLKLPWVAAIAILCIIIAAAVVWKLKPTPAPEPRQVNRYYYELPEDQAFTQSGLGISFDGTKIAYVANQQLYIKNFDELNSRPIPGTNEDLTGALFSPDGQWIAYYSVADRQFKKISINGGAPVVLCDVAGVPTGGSWSADDTIIYSEYPGGLMRVSANGGTPESIIKPETGAISNPRILPDGKTLLFAWRSQPLNPESPQIVVQSLESGERKELFAGIAAKYLMTGHLVYVLANNNLYAIRFNLDTLDVAGGPVSLEEGVGEPAISDSGTLVYKPVTPSAGIGAITFVWVDREGNEAPISIPPGSYLHPKISPDGTQVALAVNTGGNQDIRIWDLIRENMMRLTFHEADDIQPIWTPDGKRIVFWSDRDEGGIYWKNADGTGEVEFLGSEQDRVFLPWSWSGDGNTILTVTIGEGLTIFDVGMLSIEGDSTYTPLLHEEYGEFQPKISPDGRFIAYTSNESGQMEVFVRLFPEVNKGRWQVSTNGGDSPLWSPDGRELFYRGGGQDIDAVMAVQVETEPTFKPGTPKILFRGPYIYLGMTTGHPWDIHPDGKRFLMMKEAKGDETTEEASRPRINIVTNWFKELKQRVPIE